MHHVVAWWVAWWVGPSESSRRKEKARGATVCSWGGRFCHTPRDLDGSAAEKSFAGISRQVRGQQ